MNNASYAPGDVYADRFEIVNALGEGASGRVYLALDRELQRTRVALKILHPWRIMGEKSNRFENEMILSRRVRHENIVQTFEFQSFPDGGRMISMEYVDGDSLHALLGDCPGRRLPLSQAVRILAETARALAHAHQQGVLHRDLKPQNIMVARDGKVKVSDFGLACSLESGEERSKENQTLGTPLYMSPEQFRGESVGIAADIYAFGVMAFELVTGQLPFQDEIYLALALRHLHDRVTWPRGAYVPLWLKECIETAMQKRPRDRFSTMSELADCLEHGILSLPAVDWEETQASVAKYRAKKRSGERMRTIAGGAMKAVVASCVFYCTAVLTIVGLARFNLSMYGKVSRLLVRLDVRTGSVLLVPPERLLGIPAVPSLGTDAVFKLIRKIPDLHGADRERAMIFARAFVESGTGLGGLDENGDTLLIAAIRDLPMLVRPLIEAGANPNIVGGGGETPLQIALHGRMIESFEPLVRASDLSVKGHGGNNAFHTAVLAGNLVGLELLLAQRVPVRTFDVPNDAGLTPLALAVESDTKLGDQMVARLAAAHASISPELRAQVEAILARLRGD